MVKSSCVYSVFFETNIDKDLTSLEGRNKGAHPFVMEVNHIDDRTAVIEVLFIGRAINYIPYINIALENAGTNGVGRNRACYTICGIIAGDDLFEFNQIEEKCLNWPVENISNRYVSSIILETPCRIKKEGHYISEIQFDDLLKSINKRMQILMELFSEEKFLPSADFEASIRNEAKNQRWVEQSYYSGRQKTVMKLGGVIGLIEMQAEVPESIVQYINAMELFHVGKNISFGLGKIKVVYDV